MHLSHEERAERRKEIAVDGKKNGLTLAQSAKKYHVSEAWVREIYLAAGVAVLKEKPKYTLKGASFKILKGLLDGTSVRTLSLRHNITRQGIHQIKKQAQLAGFLFPPPTKE